MRICPFFKKKLHEFLLDHYRQVIVQRDWKATHGRKIDWKSPRDINEKIQWLMCFSDTSQWSELADKYRVRDYVKRCGLEHLLVPLYGVWDKAEDINYDNLPDKFVLKCNHDSGSTFIIDKIKGFDEQLINAELNKRLKIKFGYVCGETYYNRIPPKIIAEKFVEHSGGGSSSLIDYKIWCFDGKPYSIWACYNRTSHCCYVNLYDLEWNVHPECSIFTDHYRDGKGILPKPEKLDEMLNAASVLSKGFPEVRVDLYEANGKVYFGEMTFASLAGRMDFYTPEYLEELGEQVILPVRK